MEKNKVLAFLQCSLSGIFNRPPGLAATGIEAHLNAAIDWLIYVQSMSQDGGVSACYKVLKNTWAPSYPETTGYIIQTLIRYAKRLQRDDIYDIAIQMAEYELKVQLEEGGIPLLVENKVSEHRPIAFDTGQVLFGLLEANKESRDNRYLSAAIKAANWLVATQAMNGSWQDFHRYNSSMTIDTRVAWPLIILFKQVGNQEYRDAGCRQLEWVLAQQCINGWFQNCAFDPKESPFTHTLAYTIEGLLESGLLLSEEKYVTSAMKAAEALLDQLHPSGFLAGAFNDEWIPTVSWSCLTGSAQMAIIWLRIAKLTGLIKYRQAADRTIKFIATTQYLNDMPRQIRGAIAGSWPIYGGYMRYMLPNWAAKFFIDAIMTLQEE